MRTPISVEQLVQAERDPKNIRARLICEWATAKTREMMDAEGLSHVRLQLTHHEKTYARNNPTGTGRRDATIIRLGSQMLATAYFGQHSNIYWLTDGVVYKRKDTSNIRAVISILVEEVGHALQVHRDGVSHGHDSRFEEVWKELWVKYCDRLAIEARDVLEPKIQEAIGNRLA